MFGQSLLSAFGIACTTDTDQLFNPTPTQINSLATYQLNNATTSIPSNTYPGTASNITYSTGKFGNAAVFSGNSKITLDNTAFRLSTQTISLWINSSDYNPNCTLYDGGLDNNGTLWGGVAIGAQANKVYYYGGDPTGTGGSGFFHVTGTTNITNGTWVHIALVVNGTSITGYVNGLQDTGLSRTLGANIPYYGLPGFYLGVRSGNFGSHGWFNGTIDQVRIFNTALSQTAVTALYNETTTTAQNAYITEEVYSGIAYYKMSDATDQLGNYNGTATNVNFNTEGKFGFAGAFNGSSSYIDLNHKTAYSAFTISAWVNVTSTTSSQSIVSRWYDGSNRSFGFYMAGGGQLTLLTSTNGSNTVITTGGTLTANTWHFVCLTFQSSGNITITLDGSTTTTAQNTTIYDNNQNWLIGMEDSRGGQKWNGKIDQIRMYDSALSAADVTTLYKEVECEPAAINALANFNTVLYTGTGSNQAISTVGFQPDFTWIKCRSAALSNVLHDTLTQPGLLISNGTNALINNGSNTVTFSSNGFDLQGGASHTSVNENNQTYVSWNWKAPLANLSTEFNSNRQGQITLPSSITTPWNTSSEFGISCWINPSTWGSGQQTQAFSFNGPYSGNIGFDKEPSGNFRCFVTTSGGSFVGVNSSNNLSATNKWYHIVWTGSASAGVKLYVDGVNTGSASWDGTYLNNTGTNSIGLSPQSLRGNIAQFRVYSSYLTSSEVSDLYTEPAASNNTLNYPAGAGCIAAYPLQTDAVDLSGNYSGASSNVTFGQPGYLTQNTDGTITSTVAVNKEAGFSIVKYTGTGSNATIGHGLGATPQLIIDKVYNSNAGYGWTVYSEPTGTGKALTLNSSGAVTNDANFCSVVGSSTITSYYTSSSFDHIAYFFTSIPGYSQIGSYVGTGSTNNFQYTGFEPGWVMVKATSTSEPWFILDNKRDPNNPRDNRLMPDSSAAESDGSVHTMNFNPTGFTLNGTVGNGTNGSGQTYIFLAIA